MHPCHYTDFAGLYHHLRDALIEAPVVEVGEWQAQRNVPQATTVEVEDVSFSLTIPSSVEGLTRAVQPNLPWAEDHFVERVSGEPLNPPPSASWWPFQRQDNKLHKKGEAFSHSYPERMWPRFAAGAPVGGYSGIRYRYGDLNDVVRLLQERPDTRQAFLPIWFPEDTGAHAGERVPCTIGYHFMARRGRLTIRYYIRSCDFLRHFRDDVYLAGRLCQWVAAQTGLVPGDLVMHISSLHVFHPSDVQSLEYQRRKASRGTE